MNDCGRNATNLVGNEISGDTPVGSNPMFGKHAAKVLISE